ncbi:MAG TPA: hypothetical protein VK173_05840 [Lacibacter sp.]|nr:hypothetical protein [Lacibacter sp.]
MIHILFILAVLLCVGIEAIRIKVMHGKVVNISKRITRRIAAALFIAVIVVMSLFVWKQWLWNMWAWWKWPLILIVLSVEYVGIRGVLYDPLLNIVRKLKYFNDSTTTNSKTDQREQRYRINFWVQRLIYLGITALAVTLYLLIH